MNMTKNEKKIIKLLLDNGRISDVEMAEKLKISCQAVGKIRKKLEESGIIEGYFCNLNFEKMGINMFCVALIKLKGNFWEKLGEDKAIETLKNIPATIFSCMPSSSDISIISVYGFRDAKEMDKYSYLAKTRLYEYGEIVRIYPFSPHDLLKISSNQLFKSILEDKPLVPISVPK